MGCYPTMNFMKQAGWQAGFGQPKAKIGDGNRKPK